MPFTHYQQIYTPHLPAQAYTTYTIYTNGATLPPSPSTPREAYTIYSSWICNPYRPLQACTNLPYTLLVAQTHDHMHKPFIRFSPGINTPNSQYSYTAFTPVVSPLPLSLITTTRVQHIHHLHIFRKYSHPHHHHGRRPFVPFHLLHQWCPPPPPNTTGVRYSLHVHHLHNFHRVLTHHPHSTRLQYLGHLPQ